MHEGFKYKVDQTLKLKITSAHNVEMCLIGVPKAEVHSKNNIHTLLLLLFFFSFFFCYPYQL